MEKISEILDKYIETDYIYGCENCGEIPYDLFYKEEAVEELEEYLQQQLNKAREEVIDMVQDILEGNMGGDINDDFLEMLIDDLEEEKVKLLEDK